MKYYDKELQRIVDAKNGDTIKIQIVKGDKSTKWLNVNLESIESIQAFIDIVKEDLEK